MKRLTERTQIAQAINFNKYPVLSIDLADADEYGLKGCKVRIDCGKFDDGTPFIIGGDLRVFRDERKITVSGDPCCISASFGYHDFMDIVNRAQAPMIGADMDVVIAVIDSRKKVAYAPMIIHTGKRVDPHGMKPITFEDVDMTNFLVYAGVKLN